jgi:hypothetical protein
MNMKTNKLLIGLFFLGSLLSTQSCLNKQDDTDYGILYPNAVVTLKPDADGLILQLDDETALFPVNLQNSSYTKELRAFINFKDAKPEEKVSRTLRNVHVNWVDTIRTKGMAANLMDENVEVYGNDPFEIVDDWTTVCEDDYLTLRIRTYFSGWGEPHVMNLVKNDGPYDVTLYHDAKGDANIHGRLSDGHIAFRLDALPDTRGETVDLKVHWTSFSGQKSAIFKYRSRK